MTELGERFLGSTDSAELFALANELSTRNDLDDVPGQLTALADPWEERRYKSAEVRFWCVYAMGQYCGWKRPLHGTPTKAFLEIPSIIGRSGTGRDTTEMPSTPNW